MLLLAMANQGSPWDLVSAHQVAEVVRHGQNDEVSRTLIFIQNLIFCTVQIMVISPTVVIGVGKGESVL